ncbi:hypothetical protein C0J52_06149 [Blattella germanica]|nr:hypothetical protein C0J52_06149 [Blattella germanica]
MISKGSVTRRSPPTGTVFRQFYALRAENRLLKAFCSTEDKFSRHRFHELGALDGSFIADIFSRTWM